MRKVSLPSKRSLRFLDEGDVIFASRGTKNFAYPIGAINFYAVAAPEFYVLSLRDHRTILPTFLAWQINESPAQRYIEARSEGAAMKNVKRKTLESLKLNVPPLKTQQAIVDLYETSLAEERALLSLIKNRQKMLRGLATGLAS